MPGGGDALSEVGQETKRIPCKLCNSATNHILRARYSWLRQMEGESGNVIGTCDHMNSIWMCAGCDTVTFEWQMVYDDGTEGDGGCVSTMDSVECKPFRNLNPDLTRLYEEVVTCFDRDCLLLCTIGLRALIEGVCKDKGVAGRDLKDRIDGLIKFVPSLNIIEALHAFRFAGNTAVHDLEALTRDDARASIEVMEDLLTFLYDLDYKALQVRTASRGVDLRSVKPGPIQ